MLWAKPDGRVRWSYLDPVRKDFVFDGEAAYFYEPENAQVTVFERFQDSPLANAVQFLWGQGDIEATFDVGSGSFDVIIGSGVTMMLEIDGGSGSIFIDIPKDVGVRLLVDDHGSGGVRIPGNYDLVDDQGDDDRDTGIWESKNYDDASTTIEIWFDPGSGTITLR